MVAHLTQDNITSFLDEDQETGQWTVRCFVVTLPTHEAITDSETKLGAVAEKYDGVTDGWEILAR